MAFKPKPKSFVADKPQVSPPKVTTQPVRPADPQPHWRNPLQARYDLLMDALRGVLQAQIAAGNRDQPEVQRLAQALHEAENS